MLWLVYHSSKIDWKTGKVKKLQGVQKNVKSSRGQSKENWDGKNKKR